MISASRRVKDCKYLHSFDKILVDRDSNGLKLRTRPVFLINRMLLLLLLGSEYIGLFKGLKGCCLTILDEASQTIHHILRQTGWKNRAVTNA